MGARSVPERVRATRPGGTTARAIGGHHCACGCRSAAEGGRRRTRMGRCVGKTGEGRGYVPDPGRASGSGITTPGSGGWAVALSASAPVRGLLGGALPRRRRGSDMGAGPRVLRAWRHAGEGRQEGPGAVGALAGPALRRPGGAGPGRAARRARSQVGTAARVRAGARGGELAPGRRPRPRGRLGVAPRRPGRQGVSPRRHPLRPDGPARGLRRPRRLAARLPHRRGRAARRGVARRPGRRRAARRRAVARRPRLPRRGRRRAAAGREQRPRHAAARGARGTRGRRGRDGPARAARLGARAQGDGGRAGGARRGRRAVRPRAARPRPGGAREGKLPALPRTGPQGPRRGGLSSAEPLLGACVPRASLADATAEQVWDHHERRWAIGAHCDWPEGGMGLRGLCQRDHCRAQGLAFVCLVASLVRRELADLVGGRLPGRTVDEALLVARLAEAHLRAGRWGCRDREGSVRRLFDALGVPLEARFPIPAPAHT